MVSFHTVRDPFAPFGNGTVIVPTTNENVVDVSGAGVFMDRVNRLGNNNAFKDYTTDAFSGPARAKYGQTYPYIFPAPNDQISIPANSEGLFPILRPDRTSINRLANEASPWDWWSKAILDLQVAGTNAATGGSYDSDVIHNNGLLSNPDMSETKAKLYIDTIHGYALPRVVRVMQIGNWQNVSVNDLYLSNTDVSVFPNPANNVVNFKSSNPENEIVRYRVFDIAGRNVSTMQNVNSSVYTIDASRFSKGLYIGEFTMEDGKVITKKFSIE
jgi:hypothetical protein